MRLPVLAILTSFCGLIFALPPPIKTNITAETRVKIPDVIVTCTNHWFDMGDLRKARDYLVLWGSEYEVPSGCMKYERVNDVIYYQCNCKWGPSDPVVLGELEEAERLLAKECGRGKTGRVLSRTWDKTWEINPYKMFQEIRHGHYAQILCPTNCARCTVQAGARDED
ncbi:hypothetical protein F4819DRAFT_419272 [Hypoxylon fuscum]|nr:hypothetical protein F4819DRAFT_419272 [Hypoxylon fuscum]